MAAPIKTSTAATTGSGTSAVTTFGSLPSTGSDVIVTAWGWSPSVANPACGDNQSGSPNTYSRDLFAQPGGGSAWIAVFRAPAATVNAGSFAVTVSGLPGGSTIEAVATEWPPFATSAPGSGQKAGASGSGDPNASGNATPAAADDVAFAVLSNAGGSATVTTPSGFTAIHTETSGSSHEPGQAAYQQLASGSALGVSYTTGNSASWACGVVTYAAGGPDVTPPTLASPAVPSGGTTLAATLSEAGCTPSSGTGGFTVKADGSPVAVSGWAISGTTLTLTLASTIYSGQTVTYSYAEADASPVAQDAAGNPLADFTDVAVTNNSTQTPPPGGAGGAGRVAITFTVP